MMITMFKKLVLSSMQNFISAIDELLEAIEKAVADLSTLRDADIKTADVFNGNFRDCKINTELLGKLQQDLIAQKEKHLSLIDNFNDPFFDQTKCCEETVKILLTQAPTIKLKAENIFDGSEKAELVTHISRYESCARDLLRVCKKAKQISYSHSQNESTGVSEDYSSAPFSSQTLGGTFAGTLSETKNAVPPAEFPEFSAMPSPSPFEQDESEITLRQSANPSREKRILGLFKRRSKKEATTPTGFIIPPPRVDSVQFSAVASNKAAAGKYLPLNIVMYEEAFRSAVDDILRSHGESPKESRSGYHDVERNSLIRVILESPNVNIEDSVQEQKWNGKYLNFEFVTKIPDDFIENQVLFCANVYINDIIATKLKLVLDCEQKAEQSIRVSRQDILSAFVSYASEDTVRVASIIQGMKKARPDMDIFLDIENLRSGEIWKEVLKSEIAKRDVLFLCWSRYARDSKWVDMEWRYAFETKGEDGIEPIPIESPDICPPPVELEQKHFNDKMLYIIKATDM